MSIGDRRKRNNRCRNRICACTGECYIDDGTGDFAPKNALGYRIPRRLDDFNIRTELQPLDDAELVALARFMAHLNPANVEHFKKIRPNDWAIVERLINQATDEAGK